MVNNQLKYMEKKGSFAWRKTHLKKQISTRFCYVVPITNQPGLIFFFLSILSNHYINPLVEFNNPIHL